MGTAAVAALRPVADTRLGASTAFHMFAPVPPTHPHKTPRTQTQVEEYHRGMEAAMQPPAPAEVAVKASRVR